MNPTDSTDRPLPNSYWVVPGRFAAGEYPGAKSPEEAAPKLRTLLRAGIDHFIDLTEAYEGLEPYAAIAQEEARDFHANVAHERHPIADVSVPGSPREMAGILDAIDAAPEWRQDRLRALLGRSRPDGYGGRVLARPAREDGR